jgi:hypothetical protein
MKEVFNHPLPRKNSWPFLFGERASFFVCIALRNCFIEIKNRPVILYSIRARHPSKNLVVILCIEQINAHKSYLLNLFYSLACAKSAQPELFLLSQSTYNTNGSVRYAESGMTE